MANLYNIFDTVTNKNIVTDKTASEIADRFGMLPGNIRSYSDRGYKVWKRYLIINTYKDTVNEDTFKKEWDEVCTAATLIRVGKGKIKRVLVNGKLVYRTVLL